MSKPSSLSSLLITISTTTTISTARSSSLAITTRPYNVSITRSSRSAKANTTITNEVSTFFADPYGSTKPNTTCRRRRPCQRQQQQQQQRSLSLLSSSNAATTITTYNNNPIPNTVGRRSRTILQQQYPYFTKQSLFSSTIIIRQSSSLSPIVLPEYNHHHRRRRWFASTVPSSEEEDDDDDTYQHRDKMDKKCSNCPYSSSSSSLLPSNNKTSLEESNTSLIIKEYGQETNTTNTQNTIAPCGEQRNDLLTESNTSSSLPEPKYSFRRRVLVTSPPPDNETNNTNKNDYVMVPLNTYVGKQYLIETLQQNTASSYIALTEHFMNQDDPAYCGITTLLVVLNALSVDPTVVRWKGGWRYFANESVLLALHPCLNETRIKNGMGITLEQFHRLASCQGLYSIMKRPQIIITNSSTNNDVQQQENNQQSSNSENNNTTTTTNNNNNNEKYYSLDEFRKDIENALTERNHDDDNTEQDYNDQIIVVSFSRSALQQTGDGHFSPIAAYHRTSDTVLILDVARFKYQPYWVSISTLYNAMQPLDTCTNKSRGWFLLQRGETSIKNRNTTIQSNNMSNNNNNNNTSTMSPYTNTSTTPAAAFPPTTTIPTTIPTIPTKPYTSNWKSIITKEDSIPARLIPLADTGTNPCPIHPIKVNYCAINISTKSKSRSE